MAKVTNSFLLWTLELRLGTKLKAQNTGHFVWTLLKSEDGKTNCGDRDTGHPSLCFSRRHDLKQFMKLFGKPKNLLRQKEKSLTDSSCSNSSFKYTHHHHHYHHHHHHPIVNILTDLGAVLYWYTATCVYLLVLMLIAMAMLLVEIDDLANSRQTGNAWVVLREAKWGGSWGQLALEGIWIILAKPAN